MINPAKLMKMKNGWDVFIQNHPKFPLFLKALNSNDMKEGTIIEITVKTVSGKTITSNVKLTKSDAELFQELSSGL